MLLPRLPDLIAVCAGAGLVGGGMMGLVSIWGANDATLKDRFLYFGQVGAYFGTVIAFVMAAVGAAAEAL